MVALRVVNRIEKEVVEAEYENWLRDETEKCGKVEDMLNGDGEGGKAGLAAACASKALGLRCTVFLPEGVDASTIEFMQREGAEIVTAGKIYLEALKAAEKAVAADLNAYGLNICSAAADTADASNVPIEQCHGPCLR